MLLWTLPSGGVRFIWDPGFSGLILPAARNLQP